jgi:hypothetical protein
MQTASRAGSSIFKNEQISKQPPPTKCIDVQARSVTLSWLNEPKDYRTSFASCRFQVTKSELSQLKFDVVYEGEEPMCQIHNLKPLTAYRFIVRYSPLTSDIPVWSIESSQLDVTTSG